MYGSNKIGKTHTVWGGTLVLGTALLCTQFILQKEGKIKYALFQDMAKEASKKVEAWIDMYLGLQIDEIKQDLYFSPLRNNKDVYSSIHLEDELKLFYDDSLPQYPVFIQKIMRKK